MDFLFFENVFPRSVDARQIVELKFGVSFFFWCFLVFGIFNIIFRSVDARQVIDLKLGVAFSRFQTRYFRANFGTHLGKSLRSPNAFFS
jgi:hypothetical protein